MATETKIANWGNSLGVRIGRRDAARAGISRGSLVQIKAEPGKIILIRSRSSDESHSIPRYSLKHLLRGVTPTNLNRDEAFLIAKPIGKEAM